MAIDIMPMAINSIKILPQVRNIQIVFVFVCEIWKIVKNLWWKMIEKCGNLTQTVYVCACAGECVCVCLERLYLILNRAHRHCMRCGWG